MKFTSGGELGCHDEYVAPSVSIGGTEDFQSPVSDYPSPSSDFQLPLSYSVPLTEYALCMPVFSKAVTGLGDDIFMDVAVLSDGFIAVGHTTSSGAGYDDIYVVKFNDFGSVDWTRTIGGSATDVASSVVADETGYLVVGYTESFGSGGGDIFVVRLDLSGNIAWAKAIGTSNYEMAESVVEQDGDYFIVGSIGEISDILVLKLDSSGEVEWARKLKGSGNDVGFSIVVAPGGVVVTAGGIGYAGGFSDLYVLELEPSGTVKWARAVAGDTSDDIAHSVIAVDGGYLVVGSISVGSRPSAFAMKLDLSGQVEWKKIIGGMESLEIFNSVVPTPYGGFIAVGSTSIFGYDDVLMVEFSSLGDVGWVKAQGGTNSDEAQAISYAGDGYIIVGSTLSFGNVPSVYIL